MNTTVQTRNGPASGASPINPASCCAGAPRFGPATAPTVVAHTTTANARPRRPVAARSVAAKRAASPAAVAAPSSTSPASSSGHRSSSAASTAISPPTAPMR